MKAALLLIVVLAAFSACRSTSPQARNTLPRHQALTEMTTPETAEPTRRDGLALPDSSRRDLPPKP